MNTKKINHIKNCIDELREIASKRGIELIAVTRGDEHCLNIGEETFINRSFVVGKDTIYIGIYDDTELMVASFFHELGHITDIKDGMINSEDLAWEIGFRLAKEYGYKFSDNTYEWAGSRLATYNLYNEK